MQTKSEVSIQASAKLFEIFCCPEVKILLIHISYSRLILNQSFSFSQNEKLIKLIKLYFIAK